MAEEMRDDRVLATTRALAAFIVPFLVVAFVVLYGFPHDTKRLFAWDIHPALTPMVLGAVYIGGAYFFVRAFQATEWHTVKVGFIPVTVFASLLGVATVLHWDRFIHTNLAFWLWAGLYFTTPFLVLGTWLRNRGVEPAPGTDELRLAPAARVVVGVTGALSLALGLFLFLRPTPAIDLWPWTLSPLTARVMGAVFALGVAGLVIVADSRWSTARLMLQTEEVMVFLILLAAGISHGDLDGSRPLTWVLGAGLLAVLAGSLWLSATMDRRGRAPA